jgi:O-antigen/teichoic acid export membrane protein
MNDQAPTLRISAVHGVKWTGTSTIYTSVLIYVRLAILAHLLSPKDFGLLAMVMVIVTVGQSFGDMGLSSAIIWKQDITSEQLSTLYWLIVIAGLGVFGIVIAISPLVSAFFHEPRLRILMFWAALIFPITAIGQVFQILLQKNFRFSTMAKVAMISVSVGTLVAITTAYFGQGAISLIWGQLTTSACAAFLFVLTMWREWRPRLIFKPRNLHGLISFGLYQMGDRTASTFFYNVDYIMVGHFLGPRVLGVYMLAWQLMVAPSVLFSPIWTNVSFPVFARKQTDDNVLRQGYIDVSKMVAVVIFPILVLAGATAPVFVPVIFGAKWNAAIPLIEIFVLLGLLRALASTYGPMVLAKGRADLAFKLSVAAAVIATVVFWFAAQHGLLVMAWSEVAVAAVLFGAVMYVVKTLIGLKYSQYFKEIGRPILLAAVVGGATYSCYRIFRGLVHSNLWLFVGLLVFGVLCYALLIALFERRYFLEYFWLFLGKEK